MVQTSLEGFKYASKKEQGITLIVLGFLLYIGSTILWTITFAVSSLSNLFFFWPFLGIIGAAGSLCILIGLILLVIGLTQPEPPSGGPGGWGGGGYSGGNWGGR